MRIYSKMLQKSALLKETAWPWIQRTWWLKADLAPNQSIIYRVLWALSNLALLRGVEAGVEEPLVVCPRQRDLAHQEVAGAEVRAGAGDSVRVPQIWL